MRRSLSTVGSLIASTIGHPFEWCILFSWAFQRVFFGKLNEKYTELPEINRLELFTVIPLLVITLFFGIYPAPYIDLIASTMDTRSLTML